ncbi:hypothetical protein F5Y17DRAFT_112848 [Xylariaceae sp. FL0594]|nr:hypothetical protein F5Y17DRAFT_112848 [Xylariaceae sp. FL0594]
MAIETSMATPHLDGRPGPPGPGLLAMPAELIDNVLAYLPPIELAKVLQVCRVLRDHAIKDIHWRRHVLSNIPANPVQSPYPCTSWYELFMAHYRYWFLTRNILWFCDRSLTGQLILVRYDQRRGCIEGFRLVATRIGDDDEPWLEDGDVRIQHFSPRLKLHLDWAELQFYARASDNPVRTTPARTRWTAPTYRIARTTQSTRPPRNLFYPEQTLRCDDETDPRFCVYSVFSHAKPLDPESLARRMSGQYPYGQVWPPPAIPAHDRVRGSSGDSRAPSSEVLSTWRPSKRSEVSDTTFRIRQGVDYLENNTHAFRSGGLLATYSTLDPALYTPTEEKPWRGIWVGDYNVHGCEFLLLHQPELAEERDEEPLVRQENESEQEYRERFMAERVYRGRLEAIKLTGDPNVPRGEFTFVVEDLGPKGLARIGQQPPFQGARMVKSQGHVAGIGFAHDKYIDSQLILISPNRLAQYWVDLGHISFLERVDIHQFLVPT